MAGLCLWSRASGPKPASGGGGGLFYGGFRGPVVDKICSIPFTYGVVSTLRHIITVALLGLWLPTTQHCGLEAAGLIAPEAPHAAAANCCSNGVSPCTHDGCQVLESSLLKQTDNSVKAPMPSLVACTCFLCLQLLIPDSAVEPILTVSEPGRPQPWIPIWQFARRAAPLSRAPSLVG